MADKPNTAAGGLGRTTIALLTAVLLIVVVVPVVVNGGAFPATDDAAKAAIAEIAPGTQPWFSPIWSPPSHQVETLLFSLQAAVGAGLVGYVLGVRHGRAERQRLRDQHRSHREG